MRTEVEEISATKKRLKIHVPAEVIAQEIGQTFGDVSRSARIPGFRPGKVPRSVLEKRFGQEVRSQILERRVPEWYNQALQEGGLRPVATPVIESALKIDEGQPLDISLTVEVRPTIANLNYEGLQLTSIPTEPTEAEIDRALQAIRRERSTLEPAEVAEADSHVVIDYEAFEGNTPLDKVSDKDLQFDLGSDQLPPEFSEALKGRRTGDSADVTVTYPPDHPGQEVAGKTVTFRVTLKEVKRRILPELNDDFARESSFDSFSELRARVVDNVRRMKEERAFEVHQREASDKLLAAHEFDLPEVLLEAEIKSCVDQTRRSLGDQVKDKPEKELREMVHADAVRNVKGRILMEVVGEKEGVTVTEEDMRKKLAEISVHAGIHIQALVQYYSNNADALDQVRSTVFETKTFERIIARAQMVGVS